MLPRPGVLSAWLAAKRRTRPVPFTPPPAPETDPETFLEHFDRYNELGLPLAEARRLARDELAGKPSPYAGYSFGLSSGTTGEPGVFLTTAAEREQWIGTMLARFVPLRDLPGLTVALLLRHNNRLYTEATRLIWFDIGQPVADWIGRLSGAAPRALIGPPGVLRAVAASPVFRNQAWRPRLVIAGAEPLFPQDRALLTAAFGVAPRGIYQAREGFLGWGCRQGRVHLNQDLVHFEVRPFAAQPERCVPVITDFTRRSQSYRRYRMDDVLILDRSPCPCGSRFTTAFVEGRLQDVFLLPCGQCVFPLELNAILMRYLEPANQFALTQHDAATFALAVESPLEPATLARLLADLSEVLAAQPAVVRYQPPPPGEKQRPYRRLFDPKSEAITRSLLEPARPLPS